MCVDWYRNFIVQDSTHAEKNGENSDELTNEEDEVLNRGSEKSVLLQFGFFSSEGVIGGRFLPKQSTFTLGDCFAPLAMTFKL